MPRSPKISCFTVSDPVLLKSLALLSVHFVPPYPAVPLSVSLYLSVSRDFSLYPSASCDIPLCSSLFDRVSQCPSPSLLISGCTSPFLAIFTYPVIPILRIPRHPLRIPRYPSPRRIPLRLPVHPSVSRGAPLGPVGVSSDRSGMRPADAS